MEDQGRRAGCSVRGGRRPRWKACGIQLTPICGAGSPHWSATVGISSSRPPLSQCGHTLQPASPGGPGPAWRRVWVSFPAIHLLSVTVRRPGLSAGGWGGEQAAQSPGAPACRLCTQRLPGAPDGALTPSHVRAGCPLPPALSPPCEPPGIHCGVAALTCSQAV